MESLLIRVTIRLMLFGATFVSASLAVASVSLYAWDRGPSLPAILLPVPENQSPMQVWQRYLARMQADANLKNFAPPAELASPHPANFKELNYDPTKHSLLIANTAQDLSPVQSRPRNWTKLMADRGVKNFVLPPAMGVGLSKSERLQLHQEIASHFSILFPLGGADVDPHIYGESPNGARGYNGTLDFYEKELIEKYISAEKGFVYATCRGAQMTAAALGYKIIQDMPSQINDVHEHWDSAHEVQIDTKNELLAKILQGLEKISIYSYHHQAIAYKTQGPLVLAGVAVDGIAEIMTFKNGRGILMQGHPELTLGGQQTLGDLEVAKRLFDGFVNEAQMKARFTCGKLFL